MAKHTTYIFSDDAKAQAEFYVQALGGEILSIQTFGDLPGTSEANKDKVLHLSLVAAGVHFFMSDSAHNTVTKGSNINQSLEFETEAEAYAAFEKLAEGGKVNDPIKMAFWGTLFGQLEDKFGIHWMITNQAQTN